MVKGITRQVIVVHAPEPKLFEQAIFILKQEAIQNGVTEDALLKEAEQVIHYGGRFEKRRKIYLYGAFWASVGALVTGMIWLITVLL